MKILHAPCNLCCFVDVPSVNGSLGRNRSTSLSARHGPGNLRTGNKHKWTDEIRQRSSCYFQRARLHLGLWFSFISKWLRWPTNRMDLKYIPVAVHSIGTTSNDIKPFFLDASLRRMAMLFDTSSSTLSFMSFIVVVIIPQNIILFV